MTKSKCFLVRFDYSINSNIDVCFITEVSEHGVEGPTKVLTGMNADKLYNYLTDKKGENCLDQI
jgi:hypothetical protein